MNGNETMRLILKEMFRVFGNLDDLPTGHSKDIYEKLEKKIGDVNGRTLYNYVQEVQRGEDFNLFKSGIPALLCQKILKKENKHFGLPEDALNTEIFKFFLESYTPKPNSDAHLLPSSPNVSDSLRPQPIIIKYWKLFVTLLSGLLIGLLLCIPCCQKESTAINYGGSYLGENGTMDNIINVCNEINKNDGKHVYIMTDFLAYGSFTYSSKFYNYWEVLNQIASKNNLYFIVQSPQVQKDELIKRLVSRKENLAEKKVFMDETLFKYIEMVDSLLPSEKFSSNGSMIQVNGNQISRDSILQYGTSFVNFLIEVDLCFQAELKKKGNIQLFRYNKGNLPVLLWKSEGASGMYISAGSIDSEEKGWIIKEDVGFLQSIFDQFKLESRDY